MPAKTRQRYLAVSNQVIHVCSGSFATDAFRDSIEQCPLLLQQRTKWCVAANVEMGHNRK